MKKGLSKILSLACVFALLLTMALPAMAAAIAEPMKTKDQWTNGVAPGTDLAWVEGVVGSGTAKIGNHLLIGAKDTDNDENKTLDTPTAVGVFVHENDKIMMYKIDVVPVYEIKTYYWKVAKGATEWQADTAAADDAVADMTDAVVEDSGATSSAGAVTLYSMTRVDSTPATDLEADGYTPKDLETAAAADDTTTTVKVTTKYVLKYDATKGTTGAYVYGDAVDGKVVGLKWNSKSSKYEEDVTKVYFFDNKNLVTDKLYVWGNKNENSETWEIGAAVDPGEGKTRAEYAVENPHAFTAVPKGGVINNDLSNAQVKEEKGVIKALGVDGKWAALEGEVYYTVANGKISPMNKTAYNALSDKTSVKVGYQKDGKSVGGAVVIPASKDAAGNTIPSVTNLYKFVDNCPVSQKVTYQNTDTKTDKIKTNYNTTTKKATEDKTYLIIKGKVVLEGDSDGKYLIKTVDDKTRYILNEDGTVRTNTKMADPKVEKAPAYYATAPAIGTNLVKVDNKKFDPYEDVEIDIEGVAQRYCLDTNGKVVVNDYRRLIDENGSDLGVAYYTSDGITYAGWIAGDKGLKYQTNIEGRYIIVTGLQKLEEGVNPNDTTKKIDAGFYLFDTNGTQIKDKTAKLDGHKFTLKDGVVTEIDGHAPTEADIFTAK